MLAALALTFTDYAVKNRYEALCGIRRQAVTAAHISAIGAPDFPSAILRRIGGRR